MALLIGVGIAVLITIKLTAWGIATFGWLGWWLVPALIGGAIGYGCAVVEDLLRKIRW
jgi:hypothetical protein